MNHDRYMMLTGLGHALRCDPEWSYTVYEHLLKKWIAERSEPT